MKRIIIIMLIIILLAPISGFANTTNFARGKYGAGIILPLPIALHINLGNFDLDIGLYSGVNNLFTDWKTLFIALDYIFYTYTFSGAANILDFSIGAGGYGTIWFSRFGGSQSGSGPMSIGARLPLALNLAVSRKKFDLFLRIAPGLGMNIWSNGVGLRWEVFAGLGLRYWFT
ncbi:DUF3996 domain-containing protein [Borreliella yangtzensis]|uniref:Uncharacterized SAM-binding protein YcdF (DUF218 family) n=1 Tax=Borreliella yangtzensis TaxID=683292 RepID=A0ABR6PAH7_9SPIR|nr:DUF3996 domain-containing protein [Borreliella yangtzensis]MBB6042550.1 uncharacterized SAM-binding protein YcdF (DUF218 family) [Borreliella yangtzensis]WKC73519.1 DUF3996 domain-containing protein [Borreliella yangtzensis]WKC74435.1 DUF3996 domain-containing protein [Borreliella yangtzensis]